jgi:hypothetical protein
VQSPRHLEALRYARAGIPVFPCKVDDKHPACEHGFKDATTDEAKINAWWQEADYNVALSPHDAGWCVVDVDPSGLENWDTLVLRHGEPRTAEARTPRGGRHVYFEGHLPPTQSILAEGIDTRGQGSYVLVPPSIVKGKPYTWETEVDAQSIPLWLSEWRGEYLARKAEVKATPATTELDTPPALSRATTHIENHPNVDAGLRNGVVFVVACELRALGLSPEATLALMVRFNDEKCNPPLDEIELTRTVASACVNAENAPGSEAVADAATVFGAALDAIKPEDTEKRIERSRFDLISLADLSASMPPPTWLIPDFIPERGAVQFFGKRKSFKTFLALDLALGVASGKQTFGFTPAQNSVVYCVGENASTFALNHVPAWRAAHDATSGDFPFFTVPAVPRAIAPSETVELIAAIKAKTERPSLVVIDTVSRAMRGLDENTYKDMSRFSEACDELRYQLGCTVLVVRHVGKTEGKSGRGSGVLEDDFDTVVEIERNEKSLAVACYIREQRNAAENRDPYYFEARAFANSLVMFPLTPEVYDGMTRPIQALNGKAVAQALADAKAVGLDHALTTHALAHAVVPPEEHSPERLDVAVKELRRLAKGPLMVYVERSGQDFMWFLPAPKAAASGV